MLGRTNTGGGGGGGGDLNFQVIGGIAAPNNPKENTIWVDSDVEITGWYFSATEPETATQGMVWISVGTSSPVEFNALKKNGLRVYPMSAKQYSGGAWASKEAKTYINGEWKDWITLLINGSDECVGVTGGWESLDVNIHDGASARALNVTRGTNYIELTGGGGGQGGIFVTKNKIRATGSASLRISGEIKAFSDRVKIAALSSKTSSGIVEEWTVPGGSLEAEAKTYTDEAVLELPAGEYYIAFSIYSTDNQYIRLNKVYI